MLKKLRLKFVLINMLIVVTMLGIIFAFVLSSTKINFEEDSMRMLESAVMTNDHANAPPEKLENGGDREISMPYFVLELDGEGNIISVSGNYYDTTDSDEYFSELLSEIDESSENGVLEDYSLRYVRQETPVGTKIAFADMTNEEATLRHLVQTCLLIGFGSIIVFLIISVFLARWAVKPVDEAWQQQKQFVSDASHELKTPLTVITTNAELLQMPDYDEAQKRKFSENILVMAKQMRGLTEQLLDLARADNGRAKADFVKFNLSEMAEDALLPFEPLFFEKGLSLDSDIEEGIFVTGSASHLKQVTDILLDNACKYSSEGGKTLLTLKKISHGKCLLSVANTGEELSSEELTDIFKRFYRGDKVRSMNGSYGLGLSIAQSIIEEHGGSIKAESRNGKNIFSVELGCASV